MTQRCGSKTNLPVSQALLTRENSDSATYDYDDSYVYEVYDSSIMPPPPSPRLLLLYYYYYYY